MPAIKRILKDLGKLPGAPELFSHLPMSCRAGRGYRDHLRRALEFEALSVEGRRTWILERMRALVGHAESKVPFYREFYRSHGFSAEMLRSFDDLGRIPIVRKADLQAHALEERSTRDPEALMSNTGGSSGQPLTFLIEPRLVGKEAAHMHRIWQRLGYDVGCLKLRFRGSNLGDLPFFYDPKRSEFVINTYVGYERIGDALESLIKRHQFHYLHGYPSAIAGFAEFCRLGLSAPVLAKFRGALRGVFLGSEYPAPHYRDLVEEVFGAPTISWYGHSEKAILAGENGTKGEYQPFQSYGFTEAVKLEADSHGLVATNYDGYACPFIRYDTGDRITPVATEGGILASFRVTEGRVGDVVIDRNGHHVSLTGLIFGRHHGVFGQTSHLQVAQRIPGEVLLLVSGFPDGPGREERFWKAFDTTGVALRFSVQFLADPVRTPAGKVALMVPYPKS